MEQKETWLTKIIQSFLKGNLAILLIIVSLVAGAFALIVTSREEEPQIVVPLADVIISYPGASAQELERLVSSRLERMLYQIDGVEYVYSVSKPGISVVTVRFYVGQDREESLIKLYNKIQQNADKVTPGITGWVVKPIEIDDVPIVNIALFSNRDGPHMLYRVAEEIVGKLQHVPDSAKITIHGGQKRVVYVYLDQERLATYGLTAKEIIGAIGQSNTQNQSGVFEQGNKVLKVEAGPFLNSVDELLNLMVGIYGDRPVYLRDLAKIIDGPEEIQHYSRIGFGPAAEIHDRHLSKDRAYPAVTIAVAKKKGSNAVWVAKQIEKVLDGLRGSIIPDEVQYEITRNYGETANDKVNNLVYSLVLAIITVIGLLALSMSWREGIIVATAVPLTYSLTLLCNYLLGYTINRVTLFALILALGLLVDDPIVGVENIQRHLSKTKPSSKSKLQIVSDAMREVLSPIILSTLAIIVSFTPMFFISGMMGPYMAPMALNVPIAVTMSTVVAVSVTPWLCSKLLKPQSDPSESTDITTGSVYRWYNRILGPLIDSKVKSKFALLCVAMLFVGSASLALTGGVPLKMLPFDNKNEFQILVDMPESTTLETTDNLVKRIEAYLRSVPEVTNFVSTIGTASPMDFNGMVRHYYLREGPNIADLRVNIAHRDKRKTDSHALTLRLRHDIAQIAQSAHANIKLVELPPGPPVLSTVVAEIKGQPYHQYDALIQAAQLVKERMMQEPGVVDIDDSVEGPQQKLFFHVDREKAGLNGVATQDIVQALQISLEGVTAGILHAEAEQNELPIILRLPREARSNAELLKKIKIKGMTGSQVELGELGSFEEGPEDKTIYHKNQQRLVYVTAEMAGRAPAYAVLSLQSYFKDHPLPQGIEIKWNGEGEWKITLDVFRDLGLAFSAALFGIYVLLVYETLSYLIPIVIMLSIPLTMIGIMPGFWLLNFLVNKPVGGFDNPVFFTATAMIGMIALSGIVVRNALILIDFIRRSVDDGLLLREAIMQSGAVRLRPIFLTAGTTVLGAWPITLDPIFSGLAWSIIFGMFVSTAFTLVVVPVVYNLLYSKKQEGI